MTYCVAIKLNAGLVFLSDSRTNAGLDQISSFRKMMIYEKPGERFLVLLSAGNLSISQSVREVLQTTQIRERDAAEPTTIWNAGSLYDVARVLGAAVRNIHERDGASLHHAGVDFNVSLLLGGQIRGEPMRLFQVYSEGNFIEATAETPYFQIGDSKYGKPLLDRILTAETSLEDAAKCALMSMDSTLKSNLSVGLPLDMALYENDRFASDRIVCIDESNSYFAMLHSRWDAELRKAFDAVENPSWNGDAGARGLHSSAGRHQPLHKIAGPFDR